MHENSLHIAKIRKGRKSKTHPKDFQKIIRIKESEERRTVLYTVSERGRMAALRRVLSNIHEGLQLLTVEFGKDLRQGGRQTFKTNLVDGRMAVDRRFDDQQKLFDELSFVDEIQPQPDVFDTLNAIRLNRL